jgi:hypothetical protein
VIDDAGAPGERVLDGTFAVADPRDMPTTEHDCTTPKGRQPAELVEWTCPACGQVWDRHLTSPTDPAPMFHFEKNDHVTPAVWLRRKLVRRQHGERTPRSAADA